MKTGERMDKEPKPRISVEVDVDTYNLFRAKLIKNRMSMSDFIRMQVDAYLQEGESDAIYDAQTHA